VRVGEWRVSFNISGKIDGSMGIIGNAGGRNEIFLGVRVWGISLVTSFLRHKDNDPQVSFHRFFIPVNDFVKSRIHIGIFAGKFSFFELLV